MKPKTPIFDSQQIAQTVLTFPDGLKSEITLSFEEDGYEIIVEDEVHSDWTECDFFNVDASTEEEARKMFVLFVINYGK